jgi:hypothetical protein
MHYGSSLAATGAGVTIAGIAFSQGALIGISASLVLAGALIVRVVFRRGKKVSDV